LFDRRLGQIQNPKEVIRATRIFELFEAIFDYPTKVTEIRKAHFLAYISSRLETGVKPETVDREVTIVAAALGQGPMLFPEDLEDFDPRTVIKRPKVSRRKRRKRVITGDEKDAIIRQILTQRLARENPVRTGARPVTAWIFEIGWLLGLRLSECLGLLKTDADRPRRTLRVRRFKNDEVTYLAYLPDRVFDILDEAAAASSTERVFDLSCSEHTFTDIISRACRSLGITYGRGETDGVTFHSTRHSFTSRLTKVTDIATAREYTSHSSGKMVDYYSQPDEDSKRRAMEAMYGEGREEQLADIYKKVRAGKMELEEFLAALN